jgi:hypothetical protein
MTENDDPFAAPVHEDVAPAEDVTLQAQPGTDEANFDGDRFPVKDDGTIEVPPAAVNALVERGGFTVVEQPVAATDGNIRLRNADGTACSVRGTSYEPDENGVVAVPVFAAAELVSHGFSHVAD